MTDTLCSDCMRGYYVRADARADNEYYYCNNCYKTRFPEDLVGDEPTDQLTEIFKYIDEMFADSDD